MMWVEFVKSAAIEVSRHSGRESFPDAPLWSHIATDDEEDNDDIHGFLTDPDIDELEFIGNIDSIHLGTVSKVSKFSDLPQHNEIAASTFFTKINLN